LLVDIYLLRFRSAINTKHKVNNEEFPLSGMEKIWEIAPIDHARVRLLAAELDLPEPLAAILLSRGVETRAQAERFFSSSLADLPSPFLMKGMTEAVEVN
jgi:hypothetical protein